MPVIIFECKSLTSLKLQLQLAAEEGIKNSKGETVDVLVLALMDEGLERLATDEGIIALDQLHLKQLRIYRKDEYGYGLSMPMMMNIIKWDTRGENPNPPFKKVKNIGEIILRTMEQEDSYVPLK